MPKPSLSKIIGKIEDARTSAEEGSAASTLQSKDKKFDEVAETLAEVITEIEEILDEDR
jgi:hypothetical protein